MKGIRRFLAFAVTVFMAFAFALPAKATEGGDGTTGGGATITINRDKSWEASTTEARKAKYTYYKIFDADIVDANNNVVVYTISGDKAADKVAALPGNIFTKPNASSDGKYYIELQNQNTSAADIVAALKTMVQNNSTLFPGTDVTSDANPVVLNVRDDGYYLILASNGKDVAVQTTGNVTITEKNDYPTIVKEQKKEADTNYGAAPIATEIGSVVDFKVTVHIPYDATKAIRVYDKMSAGLEYDASSFAIKMDNQALPSTAYSNIANGDFYDSDADWQIEINEGFVTTHRNTNIVITYSAKVTARCLIDDARENAATIKYDDNNYVVTDTTNYETYFTGIEKVDGKNKNTKLEDVEFTLTVDGQNLKVAKPEGKNYYIPDTNGNATVVTDSDGLIIIRGLDNTKNYELTETKTQDGYNLLAQAHTLTLVKDTTDTYVTNNFAQIENNKGAQMPSTGGIGTTIFYVVGGVLVAGAVVFLLTKRRVADSE